MRTIELTRQAYEIVERRAHETKRTPGDVASEMIAAEAEGPLHPYVEQRSDILGGKPVIKGTRLAIWQIAERLRLGDTPDDLLSDYPYIPAAALYDAISYYFDHRAAIESQIAENRLDTLLTQHQAHMNEYGRITFLDLPPHV
jgi:uncharacterized protein (DUF433 family)